MLSLASVLKMYGKELTAAMQEVYWTALRDLSDEEFQRAAAVLIRRETEFPPPAMFLEVAHPEMNNKAMAFRAMMQAWWAGRVYDPESGGSWSGEQIRAACGEASYQGYLACGGSSGFQQMDDEYHGPGIRKAFMECYTQQVRANPATSLPQPTDQLPALTTGQILARAQELEQRP
jgi:hypothetical protein